MHPSHYEMVQSEDGSGPYREIPHTDLCRVCDVPTTSTCARCHLHTCAEHLPDGELCEPCLIDIARPPNRFRIGEVLTFLAIVAPVIVFVMLWEAPAAFLLEHWLALLATVLGSGGTLWAQHRLAPSPRAPLPAAKARPRLPPPASKVE